MLVRWLASAAETGAPSVNQAARRSDGIFAALLDASAGTSLLEVMADRMRCSGGGGGHSSHFSTRDVSCDVGSYPETQVCTPASAGHAARGSRAGRSRAETRDPCRGIRR